MKQGLEAEKPAPDSREDTIPPTRETSRAPTEWALIGPGPRRLGPGQTERFDARTILTAQLDGAVPGPLKRLVGQHPAPPADGGKHVLLDALPAGPGPSARSRTSRARHPCETPVLSPRAAHPCEAPVRTLHAWKRQLVARNEHGPEAETRGREEDTLLPNDLGAQRPPTGRPRRPERPGFSARKLPILN